MLSGNPKPETIHDFGGFPPELYRITYPAPGAPGLATQCVALLRPAEITAGVDGCRGLDHGAWVPLRWMYPDADIPVVQLSVQPGAGHRASRATGPRARAADGGRRADHRLRPHDAQPARLDGQCAAAGAAPVRAGIFGVAGRGARRARHRRAGRYRERAPEAARAHPTDEHFLPLFVAYGAAGERARPERFIEDS